jgi:hypothetical protein
MSWVRFTRGFDWTPADKQSVTISYPAGHVDKVTRECAREAVSRGCAQRIRAPKDAASARALKAQTVAPEPL